MAEVAIIDNHAPVQSESAAVIQMIERVATNPDVPIERLERLLDMRERINAQAARQAYFAALAVMQPELPAIKRKGYAKDRAGNDTWSFAKWEHVNTAILPVLSRYGFAISFRTGRDGDQIVVTGILSHREGHCEETTIHLPIDGSGSKNAVQSVGSSTSYGKRYTAAALLNLTTEGEDDDGAAGGAGATITEDQVEQLQELIIDVGADPVKFQRFFKGESLDDLPAAKFDQAVKMLEAKRGA
jgi:hypothetical protein